MLNLNRYVIGLNPLTKLNNQSRVSFTSGSGVDSFKITSPERFFNEETIRTMINNNTDLKKMLSDNKLPVKLNMQELQDLKNGHCRQTQELCAKIAKNLPASLKNQVNIKSLKEGALLHDFGKVLIPPEILNKNGRLTEDEHKIMRLHSEIGYNLLKNDIEDQEVLSLIRYHHDNKTNFKNFVPDINLQILNIADKYSALTEKRVYKDALSPQQALTIIYGDVQKGDVHPFLYAALVKTVSESELKPKVNIS